MEIVGYLLLALLAAWAGWLVYSGHEQDRQDGLIRAVNNWDKQSTEFSEGVCSVPRGLCDAAHMPRQPGRTIPNVFRWRSRGVHNAARMGGNAAQRRVWDRYLNRGSV